MTGISPAVIQALAIGELPDVEWQADDDLCDCTYQRIAVWRNPYLAETLEVRVCCIWADLYKQYPQFVRQIPGYWNDATGEWDTVPWEWNGEDAMPLSIWYRHLARKTGKSLAEVRAMGLPAPQGKPIQPKSLLYLPWSGEWMPVELGG